MKKKEEKIVTSENGGAIIIYYFWGLHNDPQFNVQDPTTTYTATTSLTLLKKSHKVHLVWQYPQVQAWQSLMLRAPSPRDPLEKSLQTKTLSMKMVMASFHEKLITTPGKTRKAEYYYLCCTWLHSEFKLPSWLLWAAATHKKSPLIL